MSETREPLVAFPSQTIGPFFHFAIAADARLGCLAGPGCEGDRLRLRIRVLDGDLTPVPDALLEVWHADTHGHYPPPGGALNPAHPAAFTGFGRLATAPDGTCEFETIRPGVVADDSGQAAHINVGLFARGLLRHLFTRIYFEHDAALANDPFLQLVPADRRQSLMARGEPDGTWLFEIRLQGHDETVFFDL